MEATRLRKSCTNCSQAHVACDGNHPCYRCVTWGKSPLECQFIPSRKRGRPSKRSSPESTPRHDVPPARDPTLPEIMRQTKIPRIEASAGPPASTSLLAIQDTPHALPAQTELPLSSSLASLIIDQLRQLRKENRALHSSVRALQGRQDEFERQLIDLRKTRPPAVAQPQISAKTWLEESMALRSRLPQGPFSQVIDRSSSQHLTAITTVLPFLSNYELSTEVAIDDLSKPFAAFTLKDSSPGDLQPYFVFASPAYNRALGYAENELVGKHVSTQCHPMDTVTRELVNYYSSVTPSTGSRVGPVFYSSPIILDKKRRMVLGQARHQYFFSATGKPEWCLTVIDQFLPAGSLESQDGRARTHDPYPKPTDICGGGEDPGSFREEEDQARSLDDELDELWRVLSAPSPSQ